MRAKYFAKLWLWFLCAMLGLSCLAGCASMIASSPQKNQLQERVANDPFPTAHQAGVR